MIGRAGELQIVLREGCMVPGSRTTSFDTAKTDHQASLV